ncbi:Branched-chain amino acid transporter azlD [Limosilactobacillus gastricus PS3]|uniref:Branched-chain amino acid transporter azlD n=1 Tax=Limosilactobacillus gastricus PS3 TaxID=1144300 RepID=H4GKU1_9LACO|nr:AzlD domain-containing protein [Limosilactobacillus gastricus]EHS85011.1 Branched-chain amino acid transporter azlD [Limosilactobacillus gastricus PS3]
MTLIQQLATILIAAVANMTTRIVPFKLFRDQNGHVSPYIDGLGKFLPPAIMAMLVVYCYRSVNWLGASHGLPDLIAGIVTVIVHLIWRSLFTSLILGTVAYIVLINFVFK